MSSKGPIVAGNDGTEHLHRQTIALHYQISALNKARLKFSIFLHYLLLGIMLLKLSDFILDWFDIFILELQELYIPKPEIWEWIWCASITSSFIAKRAMRRNNINSMIMYTIIIALTATAPVIYAFCIYFNDFFTYVNTRDVNKVTKWLSYPKALLWYIFLAVALQVHTAELVFAIKLIRAWSVKKQK